MLLGAAIGLFLWAVLVSVVTMTSRSTDEINYAQVATLALAFPVICGAAGWAIETLIGVLNVH